MAEAGPISLNAEQLVVLMATAAAQHASIGPFARAYSIAPLTERFHTSRAANGQRRGPYGQGKVRRLLRQLDELGAVMCERDYGGNRYRISEAGRKVLER